MLRKRIRDSRANNVFKGNTYLNVFHNFLLKCLLFHYYSGSTGEVIIEVPQSTQVHSISVEHIRPDTAQSAPKDFIVYVRSIYSCNNNKYTKTISSW